tara:strand:- start:196 stop:747 length:552 start_codon:yes stop_codon:yes gene_type:complete
MSKDAKPRDAEVIIRGHSGIYTLTVHQKLPISLEEAWSFLSDPTNLKLITPDYMRFEITSDTAPGNKMFEGQIISYRVSPLPGLRMNWVTEITHVEHQRYFVDEQRFGPYTMWHHEHWLNPVEGGVDMMDRVSYKIPLGPLGTIAQHLMVRRQLKGIFDYRVEKLHEVFGVYGETSPESKADV